MKKQLLLAGALLSLFTAPAQQLLKPSVQQSPYNNFLSRLLQSQNSGRLAQKPTDIQYRVVAQAFTELGEDETYTDSLRYKYSGTRGSNYNYDNRSLAYNTYFSSNYAPLFIAPGEDNPADLHADSIRSFEDGSLYNTEIGYYRNDKKLDSFTSLYISPDGNDYNKTKHSFNTQGYVTAMYFLNSANNGVTYDTFQKRTVTYNNDFSKIVTDSLFDKNGTQWEIVQTNQYHYNTQNKLDTVLTKTNYLGPLEPYQRFTLSYNSNGNLQKSMVVNYVNGLPQNSAKDSFGYTTGIDYATYRENTSYFMIDDEPMEYGNRQIKYPGTNGLPDSVLMYSKYPDAGTWVLESKIRYTYTAAGLPEILKEYDADNIQLAKLTMYYESYDDGVSSIKPVTGNAAFSVYPNPFTNNITIDWKGLQEKANLKLVNTLGQDVYQASLKLNQGKNELTLPSLPAGNYILLIQTADGQTRSNKMIKK